MGRVELRRGCLVCEHEAVGLEPFDMRACRMAWLASWLAGTSLLVGAAFIAQARAVEYSLGGGKAAAAVILPVHSQLARAARGLGIPRSKVADDRYQALRLSQLFQHLVSGFKELVGGYG